MHALEFARICGWHPASVYHLCADIVAQKLLLRARFGTTVGGLMSTVEARYEPCNGDHACCFGWSKWSESKGDFWNIDKRFASLTWFAFTMDPWEYA